MNAIVPFQFNTTTIRTALTGDGVPMFVAKDVADILDYDQTANALKLCKYPRNLDELNKINGLAPATKWIPESDVYRLVMRSNKPEAAAFQDWVCEEVLPAIRKTGSYTAPAPTAPPIPEIELQERTLRLYQNMVEFAEYLNDDVLKSIAIDKLKNTVAPTARGAALTFNSVPFQTHEVMEFLGADPKTIRSKSSEVGKALKVAYMEEFGELPLKTTRYIDGATRSVNVFPRDWFESAADIASEIVNG